jgi:heme/copper-type cytochrome/quinol oxidase subunit 3
MLTVWSTLWFLGTTTIVFVAFFAIFVVLRENTVVR